MAAVAGERAPAPRHAASGLGDRRGFAPQLRDDVDRLRRATAALAADRSPAEPETSRATAEPEAAPAAGAAPTVVRELEPADDDLAEPPADRDRSPASLRSMSGMRSRHFRVLR